MRLIDADLMIDGLRQEIVELALNRINGTPAYTSDLKSMIDRLEDEGQAPTVDAVPVVFCRDCENAERSTISGRLYCLKHGKTFSENFYCADGERKGGDE